jgi:hypothetical protein
LATIEPVTVHARQQQHRVVDLLQLLQISRPVDVSAGVLDDDAHRISEVPQRRAVFEVIADVGMRPRNHSLEAGIDFEARRRPAEQQRHQRADQHDRRPVVEDGPLERGA